MWSRVAKRQRRIDPPAAKFVGCRGRICNPVGYLPSRRLARPPCRARRRTPASAFLMEACEGGADAFPHPTNPRSGAWRESKSLRVEKTPYGFNVYYGYMSRHGTRTRSLGPRSDATHTRALHTLSFCAALGPPLMVTALPQNGTIYAPIGLHTRVPSASELL